jgi:low affinity Fe/Cu permease
MGLYKKIENQFERMSNIALRVFGNSMVFIAAVLLVIVWFCVHDWKNLTLTEGIYHIMTAITFLSFFIIQRTFMHFAQAVHLKINELVTAHDKAHNHFIKAEEKTSEEMNEMAKAHDLLIADEEKETGL